MNCEKQKISDHKKTRNQSNSPSETNRYVPKSKIGISMYVFKISDGKRRYSVTKHCSEEEANKFVKSF